MIRILKGWEFDDFSSILNYYLHFLSVFDLEGLSFLTSHDHHALEHSSQRLIFYKLPLLSLILISLLDLWKLVLSYPFRIGLALLFEQLVVLGSSHFYLYNKKELLATLLSHHYTMIVKQFVKFDLGSGALSRFLKTFLSKLIEIWLCLRFILFIVRVPALCLLFIISFRCTFLLFIWTLSSFLRLLHSGIYNFFTLKAISALLFYSNASTIILFSFAALTFILTFSSSLTLSYLYLSAYFDSQ